MIAFFSSFLHFVRVNIQTQSQLRHAASPVTLCVNICKDIDQRGDAMCERAHKGKKRYRERTYVREPLEIDE